METISLILVVTLASSLFFLSFYTEYRKEKCVWTGVLEQKKTDTYFYKGFIKSVYIIHVLKDNGEREIFSVNKSLYESIEENCRMLKKSGDYYPSSLD